MRTVHCKVASASIVWSGLVRSSGNATPLGVETVMVYVVISTLELSPKMQSTIISTQVNVVYE